MDLKPLKPLSGFVELLPPAQKFVDNAVAKMRGVLARAGYQYIDLPAIERAEVLTDAKDWDDTAKQMFLFQKGDTKMGLRYDGTVGLSRFVAENMNNLVFPARMTQFSKRWRGERPQRGRYREFYQLDFDVLGIGGLSINYDAEIVKLASDIYDSVPDVVGKYIINIGSRTFWNAFAQYLNIPQQQIDNTFILIDKRDKIPASEWGLALRETAGDIAAEKIESVFQNGTENLMGLSPEIDAAITELNDFMKLLSDIGVKNARINLATMRGLGYYDGLVYEAVSMDYPEIGSIGGGGRYGNLTQKFSKTKIIGSGYAIGTNRMLMTALESGRIDLSAYESVADVAVLPMGAKSVPFAIRMAEQMRANNIVVVMFLDADKKLKNQMEFSDKIKCRFSMIIGDDEVISNTITLKNMVSGAQEKLTVMDAIKRIK